MILIKNGDIATKWIVYVRDSTTLLGATGKASTLGSNAYIGKNGGTLTAVAGTFTERDATKAPGEYLYTPASGETNTNGPIDMTTAAASGCVISIMVPVQVVAFDPADSVRAGLTALPNAAAAADGGLPTLGKARETITVGSGTNGATTFSSSTSMAAHQHKNKWLKFTTGTLVSQSQQISDNDGFGNITMSTAFTGAPTNGDIAILTSE